MIESLQQDWYGATLRATLAWLWPLLAAPFIGSFLGVLIQRLPAGRPIALSRSACPRCGTRLGPRDLIPLLSFLLLGGRCRHCRQPIAWLHPLVEVAALAVAIWVALVEADGDAGQIWIDCALGWTLLALAWIDVSSLLLPDVLTLPLLLAGLALTLLQAPEALTQHCLAAALAYLSFQALGWSYRRLRGRDGLGGGDAKLLGAAGAWCGLQALPFIVLASAVIGLLIALGLELIGRLGLASRLGLTGRAMTATTQLPFGPCIALAFWLAWLHGGLVTELQWLLGSYQ